MQPTDHTLPKVAIPRKDYEAECKKQNISNVMFAYKIVSWEHYSRWPLGYVYFTAEIVYATNEYKF